MNKDISYIVFTSHCVFNTASKVYYDNEEEAQAEEEARVKFINDTLKNNIQLIQLPCPEFMMYGSERWGHSRYQFDNPLFKNTCKGLLDSYTLQIKTYLNNTDRFKVLGIVGIDGSPSCGINISFDGKWGGEFAGLKSINEITDSGHISEKKGIFMEVLEDLLKENDISLPMVGLNNDSLDTLLNLAKQ